MRNPFQKNDHRGLIAGLLIGSAVAGAAAYLLFTQDGSELRRELVSQFNKLKASLLGNDDEDEQPEPQPEYLQHRHKAPKTDREALLHNEILHTGEHKEHHEE